MQRSPDHTNQIAKFPRWKLLTQNSMPILSKAGDWARGQCLSGNRLGQTVRLSTRYDNEDFIEERLWAEALARVDLPLGETCFIGTASSENAAFFNALAL